MENATKALLMAAGVLLGILILGALVYMGTSLSSLANQQETEKEAQQLAEANKFYESYLNRKLRGQEVVSIINRVISDNTKRNSSEQISAKLVIKSNENALTPGTYTFKSDLGAIKNIQTDFMRKGKVVDGNNVDITYKCTEVGYASTGKINLIKFEENL